MSTSRLQRYISEQLSYLDSRVSIKENYRPDWLIDRWGRRLELDFYIDELSLAIEVQGAQHYVYTPIFHTTYQDFEDQLNRDKAKREICQKEGITLIDISTETEWEDCKKRIDYRISKKFKIDAERQSKINSHRLKRIIREYSKHGESERFYNLLRQFNDILSKQEKV